MSEGSAAVASTALAPSAVLDQASLPASVTTQTAVDASDLETGLPTDKIHPPEVNGCSRSAEAELPQHQPVGSRTSGQVWRPIRTRLFVWLLIAFVALAVLGGPLFVSAHRFDGLESAADGLEFATVTFGDQYGLGCVAAVLLAVLLDPHGRFHSEVELHVWARRYALTTILQFATWLRGVSQFGNL